MAYGAGASLGEGQNKAGSTNITFTTGAIINADELVVVMAATDNLGTADGDNAEVTGVSVGSLTLTKGRQFCNAQGAAAAGASASVWYGVSSGSIASGSTVTVTCNTAVVAKAATCRRFTKAAGTTIEVVGSGDKADDGVDVSAITTSGLASEEHLHVRSCGCEGTAAVFTVTSTWTMFETDGIASSGGAGATNIWSIGEFLISTSTGETSDPSSNKGAGVDWGSTMVALREVAGAAAFMPPEPKPMLQAVNRSSVY
jgi:hypothetical protein